jgi:hypothetical protein
MTISLSCANEFLIIMQSIAELQQQYHRSFNAYLNGIRVLLSKYSMRELVAKYPSIEWQHIRLSSEIKGIKHDDSVDVHCMYELRHMTKQEQRRWLKRIKQDGLTATSLRSVIRQSKCRAGKVKPNNTMREAWLVKRKLHQCNDEERTKLLQFITTQQ